MYFFGSARFSDFFFPHPNNAQAVLDLLPRLPEAAFRCATRRGFIIVPMRLSSPSIDLASRG